MVRLMWLLFIAATISFLGAAYLQFYREEISGEVVWLIVSGAVLSIFALIICLWQNKREDARDQDAEIIRQHVAGR